MPGRAEMVERSQSKPDADSAHGAPHHAGRFLRPAGVGAWLRGRNGWLAALILYGVLNAVLYAALLPMWEGFDEPFHYAYVQTLSDQHTFPQLGKTAVSTEVWASLRLTPASYVVQQNLPWVTTFGEYFRLSQSERVRARAQLERLPHEKSQTGELNHEAQQAPLAYAVLALFDRAWQSANLPERIWRLRLVCGLSAVVILVVFLSRLARRLRVAWPFEAAMLFTVLSSQMFYATTAHVANDWLAVALMTVLFERLAAVHQNPSLRQALTLSVALVAGLLTKAYFLALIPVVVGALMRLTLRRQLHWRALALPDDN